MEFRLDLSLVRESEGGHTECMCKGQGVYDF